MKLSDEVKALLAQEPSPLDAAPSLRSHLLTYPAGALPNTDHFFYWSKEAFGFRPVVGLNHVTVHTTDTGRVLIVTTQIYASHYMDGQTAVTAILPETRRRQPLLLALLQSRAHRSARRPARLDLAADRAAPGALRPGAHAHRHQDPSRSAALTGGLLGSES